MFTWPMFRKCLKYGLVGGGTFLIELPLLYLLLKYTTLHYTVAITLLFILATISNYYFSRKFVFKDTTRGVKSGYIFFLAISGIGLLLTLSIVYLLVDVFGVNVLISRTIAVGLVYLWNFGANQYFNFKLKSSVL